MTAILKNKNIFISGGTGTFGKEFVKTLLNYSKAKRIVIFSRDEFKQYNFREEIKNISNDRVRFFLGDVRDKERLITALADIDFVIHAAALKQVPAIEYNPTEAIKTNVIGAQNIIEASAFNRVKKVIALSSDKAAAPINLYGATKLLSDKLFISANNMFGKINIKFSVIRYGNVMGSRGSVIPLFLEQSNKNVLTITDERMTRFNITIKQGVNFVLNCLNKMWGGEIFVPKIPSYNIIDLARAINKNFKIKIIGIRPGEKLHEEMITKDDSRNTYEYKDLFIIFPNQFFVKWNINDYIKKYPGKKCKENFSYNSFDNKNFLSVKNLQDILQSF
jgi:UDP-N-acetylglucosamine 4,6-dehydratase (inverting)